MLTFWLAKYIIALHLLCTAKAARYQVTVLGDLGREISPAPDGSHNQIESNTAIESGEVDQTMSQMTEGGRLEGASHRQCLSKET
jgi:hypothetical protein